MTRDRPNRPLFRRCRDVVRSMSVRPNPISRAMSIRPRANGLRAFCFPMLEIAPQPGRTHPPPRRGGRAEAGVLARAETASHHGAHGNHGERQGETSGTSTAARCAVRMKYDVLRVLRTLCGERCLPCRRTGKGARAIDLFGSRADGHGAADGIRTHRHRPDNIATAAEERPIRPVPRRLTQMPAGDTMTVLQVGVWRLARDAYRGRQRRRRTEEATTDAHR